MAAYPLEALFQELPELDPIQSIEDMVVQPASPPSTSANSNSSEFVFDTRWGQLDQFSLLSRAYFNVKFKFALANGTAHADAKYQVLMSGWHLFNNAEMYVNTQQMHNIQEPGFVAHALKMLKQTDSKILKHGPENWYYPQIDTAPVAAAPANVSEAQLLKAGIRSTKNTNSFYAKLYLRDIFGFCTQDLALRNLKATFKLKTETSYTKLAIQTDDSTAAFVKISDISLVIPTIRPSLDMLNVINKRLKGIDGESKALIKMRYETVQYWNSVQSQLAGNASATVRIPLANALRRPKYLIAFPQNSARNASVEMQNSKLLGDLPTLGSHFFKVDGHQIPESTSGLGAAYGYQREYEAFLALTGKNMSDDASSFVDIDQWQRMYPFLVYSNEFQGGLRDISGAARVDYEAAVTNPTNVATTWDWRFLIIADEIRELREDGDTVYASENRL